MDPVGHSSGFAVPEEFNLLCMLFNIGVITPEKSLTTKEISERTRMDVSAIESFLPKLIHEGYVMVSKTDFTDKYYVTPEGIRKVLSIYS
jgi:predicted transcriptional regulator